MATFNPLAVQKEETLRDDAFFIYGLPDKTLPRAIDRADFIAAIAPEINTAIGDPPLADVLVVGNESSGNHIRLTKNDYLVYLNGAFKLDLEAIGPTANRTQSFQDKDGTIALLSDVQMYDTLEELTDVTTGLPGTPTVADDGRMLHYDFASGQWISDDSVNHGTVVINGKKASVGTIAKGTPVYLVGFDSDLHTVEAANANAAGTMPVIGVAAETLNDTDTKHIITFGKVQGIDTTPTGAITGGETWAVNEDLYVDTTTGTLTNVRPTGTALIQRIAKVLRVHATGGQLFIFNTARTAGLPNLSQDTLWVGNVSNIPTETSTTAVGIYAGSGTIPTTTTANITDTVAFGDVLKLDETNDRVGVNEGTPTSAFHVTGVEGITYDLVDSNTVLDNKDYRMLQSTTTTIGAGTSTAATITLPSGCTGIVRGMIVGRASGDIAIGGDFMAVFKNAVGTASIIGTVDTSIKEDSAGSPSFTVVANGGNIDIDVTGGGENCSWLVTYEYTIVEDPVA
jgi:hypothetical protein